MKIVKENIEFKRGQDSKRSLMVGRARLQPTIYANQYTRTPTSPERMAKLEKLGEDYYLLEGVGYYDVFLIDKNIPVGEVVETFEESAGTLKMPFEVLGQVIAGSDEDAMGGGQIWILEINPEDWKDHDKYKKNFDKLVDSLKFEDDN
jgi:hypothetical protein